LASERPGPSSGVEPRGIFNLVVVATPAALSRVLALDRGRVPGFAALRSLGRVTRCGRIDGARFIGFAGLCPSILSR
jgi:hypothetical protein